MTRDTRAWRIRRRFYGVGFVALLIGLVGLSIASYEKAFTKVTLVSLETDHTGMQLLPQSDVKIRGIIVGSVRKISTYVVPGQNGSEETRARLQLALNPGKTKLIPRGVTALLLPKTLFGERYVALQIPDGLSPDEQKPIQAGDTITEAQSSIELGQVLQDLYPLLLALHPEDLRATLTAMATALSGRGKELGDNLAAFNAYLEKFNPAVPQLADDLSKLGQVALTYNDAAPDLLGLLDNLQTPNTTLINHAKDLDNLLTKATSTTDDLNSFLTNNADALIQVASGSRDILALFDKYSPSYTCMLHALSRAEPIEEALLGGVLPGLHITLEVIKDQGAYKQGDQFKYPIIPGFDVPHCFGLPNPAVPFPGVKFPAGHEKYDGAVSNANPTALRSAYTGTVVGSQPENEMLAVLASPAFGNDPANVPDVAKLLLAPLVRGTTVHVEGSDG